MRYSDITLKVLAATECGIIKSNAEFWKKFSEKSTFEMAIQNNSLFEDTLARLKGEIVSSDDRYGMISVYDDCFPIINKNVKNKSEKPYLLFYRGDIDLLGDLNKNVAVIGLVDIDEDIEKRESIVVEKLTQNEQVIVSGLAKGCDSIAHKACLNNNGKTIAILPSQINKIYPAENKVLAEKIVENGGLLISEYYKDAKSKYAAVSRFIERDRLQAMFSKVIILIASYRKGEGDSGSRHAMEAARKYEIDRYVLYNSKIDEGNTKFGLNKDLLLDGARVNVKILKNSSINDIKNIKNSNLASGGCLSGQLSLLGEE